MEEGEVEDDRETQEKGEGKDMAPGLGEERPTTMGRGGSAEEKGKALQGWNSMHCCVRSSLFKVLSSRYGTGVTELLRDGWRGAARGESSQVEALGSYLICTCMTSRCGRRAVCEASTV